MYVHAHAEFVWQSDHDMHKYIVHDHLNFLDIRLKSTIWNPSG